jgi:hypothetical protein
MPSRLRHGLGEVPDGSSARSTDSLKGSPKANAARQLWIDGSASCHLHLSLRGRAPRDNEFHDLCARFEALPLDVPPGTPKNGPPL